MANNEIRTLFELDLLAKAQSMACTKPPRPWEYETVIPTNGVLACGWDQDENIVLISGSGYSVTEPITGRRLQRNRDAYVTEECVSVDRLTFHPPLAKQPIPIFGLEAGDGIHVTSDGWQVEVIYPWWPRATVVLDYLFTTHYSYLKNATAIDLHRLDGTVKCGFSPSGKHLIIMGSGGALIYSRKE
ncbi:hypothetical protein [Lysinibacillus sp. ZYM-1]|uniref:hypothetical protein n=1 Tax=Lysinibacillus sp. ZYM-1 TaxID=1681184 RepID=UPI0006CE6991|nr:hypothetical protein [Lysinibacillus sp. ZYM-1]KPN94302.1 hypothetical protein AO843_23340 [Lysinibacillus sp. ZYM-1]